MFWNASKEINSISDYKLELISLYVNEALRFKNNLFLRTIESNKNTEVFETFFVYILMVIGYTISWDFKTQNISYEPSYEIFLSNLINGNSKFIYKTFGKTEISCFFLAHKRSNEKLIDIIKMGLTHLKLNSNSKNTPIGNIYLTLGSEIIDAIIMKVFEVIYTNPQFSLSSLLFNSNNGNEYFSSSLKYDITNWKQQHGFYVIPANQQDAIYADLSILNPIFEKSKSIETKLKGVAITKDSLNFVVRSNDINDFCFMKHEPLTSTGKKSKYPLILYFQTKDGTNKKNLFGYVFYLQDNTIGKARITCWVNNCCYTIYATLINESLELTRLEKGDNTGKPIQLYNIKST
jgi:hypothetical protein